MIVNELTRAPVEDPVTKLLLTGTVIGLANHTLLISRIRQEIHIDDSAAPIRTQDGDLAGVVLTFRDVSEHRRADISAEQSRLAIETSNSALERTNADLQQFAYAASHDRECRGKLFPTPREHTCSKIFPSEPTAWRLRRELFASCDSRAYRFTLPACFGRIVMLSPAAITTRVEVESSTPVVRTETAEIGQTVESSQITELPLNGRNVFATGLVGGPPKPR